MTPKIYEAVCTKLVETWGDYAGWAHSVLFTADLRSFATYGLTETTPLKPSSPATPVPPTPTESDADYFGEMPTRKRRSRTASAPRLKRVKTE